MGVASPLEFDDVARRTYLVAGLSRLPAPWREALENLPARVVMLAPGQVPAVPDLTLLVVVTDQAGLGDLQSLLEQAPGCPVVALYTGQRPSLAALCAQVGAGAVICLAEMTPEQLGPALNALPEHTQLTAMLWPVRVLEALPLGAAVRDRNGNYRFRNPIHRQVRRELLRTLTPEAMGPLHMSQVSDPESGRVWLCTRLPLHGSASGSTLELMEDVTGRHTDQDAITRQRDDLARHARALETANRELARLDDAKSEFIALAAHELRTPLTAIRNALHLLRVEHGAESPATRFLDMAERNAVRLGTLADHLLDYTKLETRQATLASEPLDLGQAARQVAGALKADAERGQVRLHLRLPADLPTVHGDAGRLGPLLTTLMESAVRHSPEHGQVRVAARQLSKWGAPPVAEPDLPKPATGWVEMSISFSGAEVSPEQAAALFNPFAAGDKGLSWESGRFGLELAVCRKVIAAHGGAVWARPRARRICFVLRLPLLPPDALALLPLRDGLARLIREQAEPRCGVAEMPDAETAQAAARTLRENARPGWCWAVTTTPPAVVMLVPGGSAAERDAGRVLACGSSNPRSGPMRLGWCTPGGGEAFRSVLERARAARHEIPPCPEHDS
ncbi:MAG: HAMP domain-containing histidine kinase [Nitrospirota bacterium]|nr:HAMP domain-containing histidine kinase [Nitrospirota bacterium]